MKYFRFIPVVVLSICTTFLTHSAFSQTEITTLSSSSVLESETNGSFVITSTIDAASSVECNYTAKFFWRCRIKTRLYC